MMRMMTKTFFCIVLMSVLFAACEGGSSCERACSVKQDNSAVKLSVEVSKVDSVIGEVSAKAEQIKTYRAKIVTRFIQPLLESQTIRTGQLYYEKEGERSRLRVNFESVAEDDEEPEKQIEQVIFDGVWLVHIDYQARQVRYEQVTDENEPMDAFEFASRGLPIVGFSASQDWKKEFEITYVEPKTPAEAAFERLFLKVKKGSIYEKDYLVIDFWIDRKTSLPKKIIATTTEDDIHEVEFIAPVLNKPVGRNVFKVDAPASFQVSREPLTKQ